MAGKSVVPGAGSESLTSTSPPISEAEAVRIAQLHYGLTVRAERLAGEKDDNFHLLNGSAGYVLKVAHVAETPLVLELTTSALLHLGEIAPDLPVARPVPARTERYILRFESDEGHERLAMLSTFLEGRLLRHVPGSLELRLNYGRMLARMTRALESFEHPGTGRYVMWDLQHADRLGALLDQLDSHGLAEEYAAVRQCLERFTEVIRPRLGNLRAQAVHNDFSDDNILVAEDDREIAGILDFGDMVSTPLICDLAVAATNQLADGEEPMAPVLDVVRGYDEQLPLSTAELRLLYDLVRTRLAARIVITEWRARRFPENRTYIMRNTPRARALLEQLPLARADQITDELIAACEG
jgi:Ser/Thr protein kinase RdoA (MazF antagonist)